MLSLSIACPECASPPGQRCTTTGGSYTIEPGGMWTHQVRYNSARQPIVATVPHPVLDPMAKSIKPIDPNVGHGHHEFEIPVGVPSETMVGADGRRIPPPTADEAPVIGDVGHAAAAMLANFAAVPEVPTSSSIADASLPSSPPDPPVE